MTLGRQKSSGNKNNFQLPVDLPIDVPCTGGRGCWKDVTTAVWLHSNTEAATIHEPWILDVFKSAHLKYDDSKIGAL